MKTTGMKRLAFRVFIGSVIFNAALAIVVLLTGDFGETEGKIIVSSLAFSGAILLAIASEAGRGRGLPSGLHSIGTLSAGAGFVLLLTGIWTETDRTWLWQLTGTAITLAVLAPVLSLISGVQLGSRYRWIRTTTLGLATLLGAMLISAIWGEWTNDWFWRLVGVVAVTLASATIVIAVLHRVREKEPATEREPTDHVNYCPSCGRPCEGTSEQETTCVGCGTRFIVQLLPLTDQIGPTDTEASSRCAAT